MADSAVVRDVLSSVITLLAEADVVDDSRVFTLLRVVNSRLMGSCLWWNHLVLNSRTQKILQLTSSTNANEAVLAFRLARRQMKANGESWQVSPVKPPETFNARSAKARTSSEKRPFKRRRGRPRYPNKITLKKILDASPINIGDEKWVRAHLIGLTAFDADPGRLLMWRQLGDLVVRMSFYCPPTTRHGGMLDALIEVAQRDGKISKQRLLALSRLCREGLENARAASV